MTATAPTRRGEVRIPAKIKRATKQVAKILVKSTLKRMAVISLLGLLGFHESVQVLADACEVDEPAAMHIALMSEHH